MLDHHKILTFNIHVDAHFEKGSSHKVCQDYATTRQGKDSAIAVLSDGCSSSPHTDVGARILASLTCKYPFDKPLELARRAILVAETLGVKASLDCTLLMAHMTRNKTHIKLWGDGIVLIKFASHEVIIEQQYLSEAPYYISYLLNAERETEYRKTYGSPIPIHKKTANTPNCGETLTTAGDPFLEFWVYDALQVSLFSDGLNTFPELSGNEAAKALGTFKTVAGYFVQRRLIKVAKQMTKAQIWAKDDISCATIIRNTDEDLDQQ